MPIPVALITGLLPVLGEILDRIIPDSAEAERVRVKMEAELLQAANQESLAQIEVNKIEAAHSSIFVAGWRPFIGWVCGVCLALYYGVQILIGSALWVWASVNAGSLVERPELGLAEIIGLTGVLLGGASLRTFEKVRGVAR
ncbi:MAG: 3TM-type holin [Alphaproteobacteria bacterium]|nr:3TM-type holin [Alphaproteobacteria bacterium]